jgi:hypothetical protein
VPYADNDELPDAVKARYSARCQTVFRNAFNGADGDEASRFKIAHTAAGNCKGSGKDVAELTQSAYSAPVSGRELKSFAVKDFELNEEGEVKVAFTEMGIVDRDDDYTFPGAIPHKDVPISAYAHATWPERGGLLPTGKGSVRPDGNLGIFEGKFFTDTTHGRDTYLTVKHLGPLQEWSYGYIVTEFGDPPGNIKAARGLKKMDIFEVSPVLVGAGPTTRTLAVKAAEGKAATANVMDAQYAVGSLLRIIEQAALRDEEDADVADLRKAINNIRAFVDSEVLKVGTPDDLERLAAERAAIYTANGAVIPEMKGSLLVGLPFGLHFDRVLEEVKALQSRTTDIVSLRLKEGRAISSARRGRLEAQAGTLKDILDDIQRLLEETAPPSKDDASAKLRSMRMRAALAQARFESPTLRA